METNLDCDISIKRARFMSSTEISFPQQTDSVVTRSQPVISSDSEADNSSDMDIDDDNNVEIVNSDLEDIDDENVQDNVDDNVDEVDDNVDDVDDDVDDKVYNVDDKVDNVDDEVENVEVNVVKEENDSQTTGFVFDALAARFGKEELMSHLIPIYSNDIEHMKRIGYFNVAFPTSVRRLILGFAWKNTKNIALVCRLWRSDVKSVEYWTFAVNEHIRIQFPFFPFLRMMGVSRQAKLGWLFTKSLNCIVQKKDCIMLNISKYGTYGSYKWKYYPNTKEYFFVDIQEKKTKTKVQLELPTNFIGCTWKLTVDKVVQHIRWQDPTRDIAFEGQGNEECIPHGDGTWMKFKDKMFLLSGENVAKNGKMSFVECKSIKLEEL